MKMFRNFVLVSGMAIAAAVFPTVAQEGQQQTPTEDHSAHHAGTDQQVQQAPGGGMTSGMMGHGMQRGGMMGGGCPMMGGTMGSGQQGMMGQGTGQGMMGSGMMQGGMGPGMGGLFGSRVTPMMNLSVEDMRGYLAVQLARLNNKRLKIGDIKSDDGTITADIVTIDNSLVQRLKVDRHTGAIEYEN
jgi:hypothetical protein